jgi:hypothetical protein
MVDAHARRALDRRHGQLRAAPRVGRVQLVATFPDVAAVGRLVGRDRHVGVARQADDSDGAVLWRDVQHQHRVCPPARGAGHRAQVQPLQVGVGHALARVRSNEQECRGTVGAGRRPVGQPRERIDPRDLLCRPLQHGVAGRGDSQHDQCCCGGHGEHESARYPGQQAGAPRRTGPARAARTTDSLSPARVQLRRQGRGPVLRARRRHAVSTRWHGVGK